MARAWVALFILMGAGIGLFDCAPAWAQVSAAEVQALKDEIQKLTDRLLRLEQSARPAAPVAPAAPAGPSQAMQTPAVAPQPGEREIDMQREHIFETVGLPKPEVAGVKLGGFFVGSFSYNSHIQMVPEFAGGAQALADARRSNFRFDKFGFGVSKSFASWLSAGAAIEVESHRDAHSHLISASDADRRGCPTGQACERFGAEEPTTEVVLDKFNITGIVPIGNGLSVSIARFDLPFGIERHDEPLNLTATTSEVFQFGRPQKGTGLVLAYQFIPQLDVTGWMVNRWENDTTHDPFDDNNKAKTFGGRLGFTPFARDSLLNFGIGGSVGAERANTESADRWIIDADVTWSPTSRLLFAGEVVYGGEDRVTTRQVGRPISMAESDSDRNWLGFYALAHYDVVDWLGLSFRYGWFDDMDGARTGTEQILQSFTFAPVVHLSRLIPDLKPTGVTYARTRHFIDWLDMKLEYRLNHSNRDVFSSSKPGVAILDGEDTSHQFQLQFVVNF
jgi:putative OmpL-like beta-barrel porin-2